MLKSTSGSIGRASSCPSISRWTVSSAGGWIAAVKTAPDDHFAAAPDRRVTGTSGRRVRRAGRQPTVADWIISPTGVEIVDQIISAPDDHFTAGPHSSVRLSGRYIYC